MILVREVRCVFLEVEGESMFARSKSPRCVVKITRARQVRKASQSCCSSFFLGGGGDGFLSTFVSKGFQFATESINIIFPSVYCVVDKGHRT